MTTLGALAWMLDIMEMFETTIHPHSTWMAAHVEPQRQGWACYGCDGEFESVWPTWEKPTAATFPHGPDCRYVAAMRAAGRWDNSDVTA